MKKRLKSNENPVKFVKFLVYFDKHNHRGSLIKTQLKIEFLLYRYTGNRKVLENVSELTEINKHVSATDVNWFMSSLEIIFLSW